MHIIDNYLRYITAWRVENVETASFPPHAFACRSYGWLISWLHVLGALDFFQFTGIRDVGSAGLPRPFSGTVLGFGTGYYDPPSPFFFLQVRVRMTRATPWA